MDELELGKWDWILLSVALATLASLLHWLVVHRARETRGKIALILRNLFESPWFTQPLRLVYAVGLPAALLFGQRALTARGLGLQPLPALSATADTPAWAKALWTDWAGDLGWAALVASVTLLLVLSGDRVARRKNERRTVRSHHDLWMSLRDAIYHQAHWAFYREPFVVTWGTSVGCWLGILPVFVEAVLNPMLWEGMRGDDTSYARHIVVRGGLYVATTLIFLKAQNLWVAVAVDVLLGWLLIPVPLGLAEEAPAGAAADLVVELA